MNVETSPAPEGTEIRVETQEKIAVVVRSGSGERIYLPSGSVEDSSYYAAEPEKLLMTEYGYRVVHRGDVEKVEIIG